MESTHQTKKFKVDTTNTKTAALSVLDNLFGVTVENLSEQAAQKVVTFFQSTQNDFAAVEEREKKASAIVNNLIGILGLPSADDLPTYIVQKKATLLRNHWLLGPPCLSNKLYLPRRVWGFIDYLEKSRQEGFSCVVHAFEIEYKQPAIAATERAWYGKSFACDYKAVEARSGFWFLVLNTYNAYKSVVNIGQDDWTKLKLLAKGVWESADSDSFKSYTITVQGARKKIEVFEHRDFEISVWQPVCIYWINELTKDETSSNLSTGAISLSERVIKSLANNMFSESDV